MAGAHRSGDARSGVGGRGAAARLSATGRSGGSRRPRQRNDRRCPTAAARGLAPSRQVLPNGVTVLAKATSVTPAVTLNASIRAGAVVRPARAEWRGAFRVEDDRSRNRDALRRSDRRGARQPRRLAGRRRSRVSCSRSTCTCLVEDFETVLARLADIIRHPAFPAAGGRVAPQRGHHADQAGRGQSGRRRGRWLDGVALRRRASVRTAAARDGRDRRAHRRRGPAGVPRQAHHAVERSPSPSSATSSRTRAVDAASAAFGAWAAAPRSGGRVPAGGRAGRAVVRV